MAHPEMPYLAASAIAVAGGTMRDGHLPDLTRVVIGTVIVVLVATSTSETKLAPLVHAFGMLVLLVTILAATNVVLRKKGKMS